MEMLLHVCCAPDATTAVVRIKQNGLNPILYFYNPNIEPYEEYQKRVEAVSLLAKEWGLLVIVDESGYEEWKQSIIGLEKLGERSKRCEACIAHRLRKTAEKALSMNIKIFCTTLTTSPKKDAKYINSVGAVIARQLGLTFLETDFKKHDGFKQSIQYSKELGLYRQRYCGCIHSFEERFQRGEKK